MSPTLSPDELITGVDELAPHLQVRAKTPEAPGGVDGQR